VNKQIQQGAVAAQAMCDPCSSESNDQWWMQKETTTKTMHSHQPGSHVTRHHGSFPKKKNCVNQTQGGLGAPGLGNGGQR